MIIIAGFRSRRRDVENPPASIPQASAGDSEDHSPDYHDRELHEIPDKEAMDQAIADFLMLFEKEERGGYRGLHATLSRLPMPGKVDQRGLSVTEAIDAGMMPRMDEEEARRFTPTEVLLYQHAQDRRYTFYLSMV
jgi:hypothetical protein